MPLRVYDNDDWRSPTSISIYDNSSWRTAKVGYVYDTGIWRVVFPDPITPSISVSSGPFGDRQSVYVNLSLVNTDYIIAELYAGSTQTTLVQTQTIEINELITDPEQVRFNGLSNNTTYNMKITAYSITENTSVYLSGPVTTINVIVPTVNITSIINEDVQSATINWTSTNQYQYRVVIRRTSDSLELWKTGVLPTTGTETSVTAYFNAVTNTNYTVSVEVISTSFDGATDTDNFTTPNIIQPQITSLTGSSNCSSITMSWVASQYVSGRIGLHQITGGGGPGSELYGYSFSSPISSYTFTGLPATSTYSAVLTLTSSTGNSVNSYDVLGERFVGTTDPSVNTPTNFTGSSNFYGNGVNLSWTAAVGNCSSVTGYNVQYKLSSSGTWLTLVNGITATSADTTLYVTLTANTSYDFRVRANGSGGIVSEYATTTITTNNNPHNIFLYTLPISTTTFTAVSVIAQLRNISNQNVTNSGISVNFSASPSGRGTFSSTSATTGTNGQATVTFTPNQTTGDISLTATSSGLVSGSWNLGVALSPGLTPSLSTARTNFGYDVTHSNYNSLYSYSGTVTNGGFNFDGVWNDGFYTIVIPPINTATPVASRNALVSVTCTSGTWTAQPSATTQVTSSRTGYTNASASVSNTPTGTLSFSYTWYFANGALAGSGQTLAITSAMRGRNMYCIVIATRTGGTQGFQAQSNTIAIPA